MTWYLQHSEKKKVKDRQWSVQSSQTETSMQQLRETYRDIQQTKQRTDAEKELKKKETDRTKKSENF